MYKKLTFLFVTTFVIALAFFSSYFVIQEVRGVVNIGGILDMNNHSIANLGSPTVLTDLVTKGYLKNVGSFYIGAGFIDSWCDVQYFDWCSGAPDPVPPPPETVCDNGICESGEDEFNCWEDCGCNGNGICEPERKETKSNCEDCEIIH